MHHSFPRFGKWRGAYYEPNYGQYQPKLTLLLEKGDYTVTFIEPATLAVLQESKIESTGGKTEIVCPMYTLDLAVKIIRQGE